MSMKSGASQDPFAEEDEIAEKESQQSGDATTADQPSDRDSELSVESRAASGTSRTWSSGNSRATPSSTSAIASDLPA